MTRAQLEAEITLKNHAFKGALTESEIAVRRFEAQVTGLFKRTGDLRAERALEGFTRALVSGDITGAISQIASRMTGLGLIVGTALGLASVGLAKFVSSLRETVKADEELHKSMEKVIHPRGVSDQVAALDTLQERYKKAADTIEQQKERIEKPSRMSRFMAAFFHGGSVGDMERPGFMETRPRVELRSRAERGMAAREMTAPAEMEKVKLLEQEIARIKETGIQRELQAVELRLKAAAMDKEAAVTAKDTKGADRAQAGIDRLRLQRDDLQRQIEQRKETVGAGKSIMERSELTFAELIDPSKQVHGNVGSVLELAQQQAKEAQREIELGEKARAKGHVGEAFEHFREAERIKSQIEPLSEKEKMPEAAFKTALGTTEMILSQIRDSLSGKEADQSMFLNK